MNHGQLNNLLMISPLIVVLVVVLPVVVGVVLKP